jgi:hypothetical protein
MFLNSTCPVRTPMLCMRSGVNSTEVNSGTVPSGGVLSVNPSMGGCSAGGGGATLAGRTVLHIQYAPAASVTFKINAMTKSRR